MPITEKNNLLASLRGKIIVSCQPVVDGPMDSAYIISSQAQAVKLGGAGGLRVEGAANVCAVAMACDLPLIGLIKRDLENSPVRITPLLQDVDSLAANGAEIIAFDATQRPRPEPTAHLIQRIHGAGAIAMADCSTIDEARKAVDEGVDIIASTMSGYTGEESAEDLPPDFQLIEAMSELDSFVIAEGRIRTPDDAANAIRHGADAVAVGSAITRIEHITSWYENSIAQAVKKLHIEQQRE